ncbi:CxC2 domain-containing protein [Mycena indigotica]|uniref:CxC2 domain-containing protein n=1 Tax=Mycena indigotica TaxID=2126181 RepID=A0A8H6SK30_9AGAR|nr:CxC2 domain-containing protein [Mycena indigotica]KAF7301160.1 CxC2 domain-containing protein [Mycena indigotica]
MSMDPQAVLLSVLDISADAYLMGSGDDDWTEDPAEAGEEENSKLPRVLRPADPALHKWMLHHRDEYLRILLWHHGRGNSNEKCLKECGVNVVASTSTSTILFTR